MTLLPIHRKLFIFVLSLAAGSGAAGLWLGSHPGDIPTHTNVMQGAPVGYLTFAEMLAATDATLSVTVTSEPTKYVDFGADRRPDFAGDKGVPVELVSAIVIDVLRGDPHLKGTTISISQPSAISPTDIATSAERTSLRNRYVIVARKVTPNPGVGDGTAVWVPAGSGQGLFDVNSDGSISVRKVGVNGMAQVTDLKPH
jgi:hypothetical protein